MGQQGQYSLSDIQAGASPTPPPSNGKGAYSLGDVQSTQPIPSDQWLIEHSYAQFPGRDKQGNYNPLSDEQRTAAIKEFNGRSSLEALLDKGSDLIVNPFVHHVDNAVDAAKQGQIARAGNESIKAAVPIAAAAIPEAVAARPISTLAGLATGFVAGKTTEGLSKEAGLNPDQAEMAGNIGGLAGGIGASKGISKLSDIFSAPLQEVIAKNGGKAATLLDLLDMEHPMTAARRAGVKAVRSFLAQESQGTDTGTQSGPVPAGTGEQMARVIDVPNRYVQPGPSTPVNLVPSANKSLGFQGEFKVTPNGEPVSPSQPNTVGTVAGATNDTALFQAAKAKLGPNASISDIAQEAQRMKVAQINPPATSQVLKDAGVTQAMKDAGVAAPSASMRPVRAGTSPAMAPRADLQFPPGLSGEDAAMMQLTRQNINELRFIAQKRGLPVAAGDTHAVLINKIASSLKPEEVAGFAQVAQQSKVVPSKFQANNDIADNLNEAAANIQAQKGSPYEVASLRNAANTIRSNPADISEVDLNKTKLPGIDKRITKRINDYLQAQNAVPGDEEVQTTIGQPMSIEEALRRSLMAMGKTPPN